jgi:CMP-N-acetylneuraminic acid synthetase
VVFSAIVPIKAHSQRLPGKNFRLIGGRPLFEYVLDTLFTVEAISEIIIDTDCPEKLEDYCRLKGNKLKLLQRPAHLLGGEVVMNTLLGHSLQHAANEHIIQTHVTNPLLSAATVSKAIDAYRSELGTHDSLFSVIRHQKCFYDSRGQAINHNPGKLVRTQELLPLYEENSCLFLFSKSSFKANGNNRLGKDPRLFEMDKPESIDIDEEDEFKLAQYILEGRAALNQK